MHTHAVFRKACFPYSSGNYVNGKYTSTHTHKENPYFHLALPMSNSTLPCRVCAINHNSSIAYTINPSSPLWRIITEPKPTVPKHHTLFIVIATDTSIITQSILIAIFSKQPLVLSHCKTSSTVSKQTNRGAECMVLLFDQFK